MKILGIETSCDETAIAVIGASDRTFSVLSNAVSSQTNIHRKWGGVVPGLAKREHQKNLVPVLQMALMRAGLLKRKSSKTLPGKLAQLGNILEREPILFKNLVKFLNSYKKPEINLIAVTTGLGLEPALWVGINFAKALSFFWEKPILPINHIEGHLLVNFIENDVSKIKYPAVCLTVSGGHTILVLMEGLGKYKIIGETRDDSAGECFDKTARLLGLGYPGGPAIARAAKQDRKPYGGQTPVRLPRPMIHSKDYDFSFSGLKTAVLYEYKSQSPKIRKSKNYISAMAAEIQQAIVDVLIAKTLRAAKEYKAKTVMIGGGVAANSELRAQLQDRLAKELPRTNYLLPDVPLCTDNGAMTAVAGYFAWKKKRQGILWQDVKAEANLKI